MPELPEVETLARDLRRLLVGAQFRSAEVCWPGSIALPTATEFAGALAGQTIEDVTRRGKFLVITASGSNYLLIHLRMSGQLRVEPSSCPADKYARLVLHLADGRQLVFSDTRKFGRAYWTSDPASVLGSLGLEPLEDDFTAADFRVLLSKRKGAIKPLLLNQSFIAGLGNIYTDEALFVAGIHPLRKANTLSSEEASRLYHAVRSVLQHAVEGRGTTLGDERYLDAEGWPGSYAESLCVYQRAAEPCLRCGTPIERLVVGGRGTYLCPHCQRDSGLT